MSFVGGSNTQKCALNMLSHGACVVEDTDLCPACKMFIFIPFSYKVNDVMPLFVSKPVISQNTQWLFCFVRVLLLLFSYYWFVRFFVLFLGSSVVCLFVCLFVFPTSITFSYKVNNGKTLFCAQTFYFPKHAMSVLFCLFCLFFGQNCNWYWI